ncbi:MAG: cyclic nucleotide-binding domain-containing protein [Desulfobacterales bacterium]|nr:cyclic nucleotide-binding domain-containing protein [Desulfobacterales bacterium]
MFFFWLKNKNTRFDGAIALSVIATIVFSNLVMAVVVGVTIAIIIFIQTQIKTPIIHRRVTAEHHHSFCARTDAERKILDVEADKIIMIELRGNLFFATADRLLTEIEQDTFSGSIIILHFRRVKYIDLTGMILLLQIDSRAAAKGATLIFCHLREELGFGEKVSIAFQEIDKKSDLRAKIFHDTDTAFEYAENIVLEKAGCSVAQPDHYTPLEENNFCNGMPENIITLIQGMAKPVSLIKGSTLFKSGDFGQSLFLILKGEIEIRLYTSARGYKRLAKYGPGTYFGEIAFLTPGPRAASAIVTQDTEILEIDRKEIMAMDHNTKAGLALYLLYEIGGTLGEELRRSADDIYRLEQW